MTNSNNIDSMEGEVSHQQEQEQATSSASEEFLSESADAAAAVGSAAGSSTLKGGPLNLDQIRRLREQQSASPKKSRSEKSPSAQSRPRPAEASGPNEKKVDSDAVNESGEDDSEGSPSKPRLETHSKRVEVPSIRGESGRELDRALHDALDGIDLERMLVGDTSVQIGRRLEEGQRYPARVIKVHNENVFMSLGGPDEGIVPVLQFPNFPRPGDQFDCIVRSFNEDEGIYQLAIPGEAVNVADWADIEEGAVIEARVESANTGGLECKVGSIRAFIPMSQISEFRVESPTDYVGKKLLCVVTEANARRGNLVLSHRAVLERERLEKRKERLANLEPGQIHEGTVRKVMDFGAFVDIGGIEGLIHVSQLSWDRVNHPSEVVKEGDRVKVRVEKVDADSGKISLSYRTLQSQPWDDVDARFPIGSVVSGVVSRIATFGAFVKLAPGIEGLVHLSELANHRVTNVSNAVSEGQTVDVKVLSISKHEQRIGLSIRQAMAKPKVEEEADTNTSESDESPVPRPAPKKRSTPLKGGIERSSGGEDFGLKW